MDRKALTYAGFMGALCILFLSYSPSKKQILANQVRTSAAKQIASEKNLHTIGTGGQMMDQIEMLSLSFQGYQEIELNKARQLIVYAAETLINQVNSNEEIRPYLANYPFTAKNIEICIFLYKTNHSEVETPNISFVVSRNNYIKYYPGIPDYNIEHPCLIESYDEAVKVPGVSSAGAAVLKKSYWVAKIEPFCVHAVDSGRQPVLPKVRQNGSHPHLI